MIDDAAFYDCDLRYALVFPESVREIGDYAFAYFRIGVKSLPESVVSIGEGAFAHCDLLGEATIPDGVTSIGKACFEGCESLTSVTLPAGISTIEEGAFSGCRQLKAVRFKGTREQWDAIEIGGENEPLAGAEILFAES